MSIPNSSCIHVYVPGAKDLLNGSLVHPDRNNGYNYCDTTASNKESRGKTHWPELLSDVSHHVGTVSACMFIVASLFRCVLARHCFVAPKVYTHSGQDPRARIYSSLTTSVVRQSIRLRALQNTSYGIKNKGTPGCSVQGRR